MPSLPVPPLKLIGGFFGLEPAGPGGLAEFWGAQQALAWENGSSAFAALIEDINPAAVWMPGYICSDMGAVVPEPKRRFFALTEAMEPDLNAFDGLQDGDLVLAVNYFGRAPGPEWRRFVASRPGVCFVEDCAQTLGSGAAPWGDWRLFSPRKLMGVPQGGLLVPSSVRAGKGPAPALPPDPETARQGRLPMELRAAHPADNVLWHPLHQVAERLATPSLRAMDPAAFVLLASLDPAPMIAARRANFAELARLLPDFALIRDEAPTFAPFAFPLALPADRRDAVLARIYAQGVFPAIHWRDIPAPPSFAADHDRAARLISLPCDHRYDLDDMTRLSKAFLGAVR